MPFTIPIDGTLSWFKLQTTLDGVEFGLSLEWNTRDARWYLSVGDANGVELVSGVPLVVDFPLLRRFADSNLPAGWLLAMDTSGNSEEMTEQEELGVRVQLIYLSAEEVAAL